MKICRFLLSMLLVSCVSAAFAEDNLTTVKVKCASLAACTPTVSGYTIQLSVVGSTAMAVSAATPSFSYTPSVGDYTTIKLTKQYQDGREGEFGSIVIANAKMQSLQAKDKLCEIIIKPDHAESNCPES